MRILIKNATLISMAETRPQIEEKVDILIEGRKIEKIATGIKEVVNKVIDATGKVVIPGLINTHAHVPMSIFRETLDGYSLQEWLEKKIWPMEDKLTPEDIYQASLLSCIEMIKTGTTTINDMYFMSEDTIKAALNMKVRMQVTRTLMDIAKDGEKRIIELEQMIQQFQNKYTTITLNVGIHGFYTSNISYIEQCVALARKYELPIHIHFCENTKEVQDIQREYKVDSPVELLKKYFKGTHVILAHAVKLSEQEIAELKGLDIAISHCPVSNLKLGCGVANIQKMLENSITVSLGTDGQGSGSNLDLFETMKYTALLQKGIHENPKILSAYEVLKMATIQGAYALGMEKEIGSVEEGKLADLIVINMDQVITQPMNYIIAELVYNVKGSNVNDVMIDGNIVMEGRKIVGIEEQEVYQKCNEIIKRIQIDIS